MSALATATLVGVGYLPTRRLAGDAGGPAMLAGAAIGLLSAALAGWTIVVLNARTPEERMRAASAAMAVRLVVVAGLGIAAALSGLFARTPLLFWLAASYVALLPLEVKLAIDTE
jgi:hypothetical protein